MPHSREKSSLNTKEISFFDAMAPHWWDESGPNKLLHRMNPARLQYIRTQTQKQHIPIKNSRILDIGCGGGLICEPLCRLGGNVTGIDASDESIKVANLHATEHNLTINYHHTSPDMYTPDNLFDIVIALEVIEHTDDISEFFYHIRRLLRPNGLCIISTLNRTLMSFITAIGIAEYLARFVPKGTHKWQKFITPAEMASHARKHHLHLLETSGMVYAPLKSTWHLSTSMHTNYIATFRG